MKRGDRSNFHRQGACPDDRAASLPSRVADRLANRPLLEIKSALADGTLLFSLREDDQKPDKEEFLTGIHLSEERYEEDSVFLVLNLEFRKPGTRLGVGKELLLQYLAEEASSCDGAIRFWYYPDDPELPSLSRLVSSAAFLQSLRWDRGVDVQFPEEILIQRFLYNPGRRATFLLSSERNGKKYILKIFRPKEFQSALDKHIAIESSGLGGRIILPSLAAVSRRENLFLYDYLPGLRIDRLESGGRNAGAAFSGEAARILSEVHRIAIPDFPQWIPQQEIMMISCLSDCLEEAGHASVLTAVRPLFDSLIECFIRKSRPYTYLIHSSFSAKHLLDSPEGLAVIDWDNALLGPPEKDIALFLASVPEAGGEHRRFIELYQDKIGRSVDLELVNGFLQHRRLLKACRKILRDGGGFDADLSTRTCEGIDLKPVMWNR